MLALFSRPLPGSKIEYRYFNLQRFPQDRSMKWNWVVHKTCIVPKIGNKQFNDWMFFVQKFKYMKKIIHLECI